MPENRPSRKKKRAARAGQRHADQRVIALLEQIGPEFIEAAARKITAADVGRAAERSRKILELFDRNADLQRFKPDAERMLSMLVDHLGGRYTSMPVWTVAVVTFALLYVLKPVDIIPDDLPEIGRLDDALVVSHAVGLTKVDLQNYKVWRLAADIK